MQRCSNERRRATRLVAAWFAAAAITLGLPTTVAQDRGRTLVAVPERSQPSLGEAARLAGAAERGGSEGEDANQCSLPPGPLMATVPEEPVWVADGVTEYRVYIYVDNSGLDGVPTGGVQWNLLNSPASDYVAGSVSPPDVNDFFEGFEPFFTLLNPPGQISLRAVFGSGPADYQGYVVVYKFTVPIGTQQGNYNFGLSDTKLSNGAPQPHSIENIPFTVD